MNGTLFVLSWNYLTKRIASGKQDTVRFVYQPLEELYILLVTTKSSNILQDIATLSLVSRVTNDLIPGSNLVEANILSHSFELLSAFDEIISLGHTESVTLSQIRTVLEADSHEERIQDILNRNKEMEAKEEIKRRAKQLEIQKREAQRQGRPITSAYNVNINNGSQYQSISTQDAITQDRFS